MTGLVAQQQCVGPLHTPLADVAVVALSPFETVGGATAIGEQPIKGLIDPAAGARLAVTEALTNLVFACVSDLKVSPHTNKEVIHHDLKQPTQHARTMFQSILRCETSWVTLDKPLILSFSYFTRLW